MLPRWSRAINQICNRAAGTMRNGDFNVFTCRQAYSKVAAAEVLDSSDNGSATRSEVSFNSRLFHLSSRYIGVFVCRSFIF